MVEIGRSDYLETLNAKRNNGLIKIITGVRRCGKSYLLFTLFHRQLLSEGIGEDHIISLALDDFKNRGYLEPESLYDFVIHSIHDDSQYYVLLDEIQMVQGFESVLNGFLHIPNADVYVTGSNSKFLSSDIVTEFRGRGDEVRVYPFSFSEIYNAQGGDKWESWDSYCRYGGMPQTLNMTAAREKETYLKNLFNQVYLSDIVNRNKLRGSNEMAALTNVLASSIGSLSNPRRICDTFSSSLGIGVSQPTVNRYLDYLEDSFLIEKAMRYDVKGRKYIGTPMKYYFVDVGLRNARLNFRQQEETHIMENIIYNDLRRRGFSVDIGVVELSASGRQARRQLEVDFVANQGSSRYYIQSALSLDGSEKMRQEKEPLRRIGDSFKKIVVSKTAMESWHDDDGILHLSLFDFLLRPESMDW